MNKQKRHQKPFPDFDVFCILRSFSFDIYIVFSHVSFPIADHLKDIIYFLFVLNASYNRLSNDIAVLVGHNGCGESEYLFDIFICFLSGADKEIPICNALP